MYLILAVRTSDLPFVQDRYNFYSHRNRCRMMSIGMVLLNERYEKIDQFYSLIRPSDVYQVSRPALSVFDLTWREANEHGREFKRIVGNLRSLLNRSMYIVAHSPLAFFVLENELERIDCKSNLLAHKRIYTLELMDIFGFIKPSAMYMELFKRSLKTGDALDDAYGCGECFFVLQNPQYLKEYRALKAKEKKMYLVYDLETSGLPNGRDKHYTETEAFDTCRIMSIALVLIDDENEIAEEYYAVVKPDETFTVSQKAQELHGISWEDADRDGVELSVVMKKMKRMLKRCDGLVAHNLFGFDYPVLMSELYRRDMLSMLKRVRRVDKLCTMRIARQLFGKGYMKLSAVYANLFQGKEMENAHNALDDAVHCAEIFIAMHLKETKANATDECKPGSKRSCRSIAN